jgi:hypothetical protein
MESCRLGLAATRCVTVIPPDIPNREVGKHSMTFQESNAQSH